MAEVRRRVGEPPALRATVAAASRRDGDEPVTVVPGADERRLELRGDTEAILRSTSDRRRILLGDLRRSSTGAAWVEMVVDGWRVEVEVEPERRAALRERAGRQGAPGAAGGPLELHAIIPGRVVSVAVLPGDDVAAGQQLLVIEAMKMQNELRAPRDGRVGRLAVGAGETIEVGDLLLVIEPASASGTGEP